MKREGLYRSEHLWQRWWSKFVSLAVQSGLPVWYEAKDAYREYFDDGDTPEQALATELKQFDRKITNPFH